MSARRQLIEPSCRRKAVPLSSELRRCLVSAQKVESIFHKLLTVVPYFPKWNGEYNDMLVFKKSSLREAMAARDWHSYLMLHEPPYRLQALRSIQHKLSDREYWELLAEFYLDADSTNGVRGLAGMLNADRGEREGMMTKNERAWLARLPDEFTVFRGASSSRGIRRWSWTLSYSVAQWFAHRWTFPGVMAKARVKKSDVTALLLRREEVEVLVNPENLHGISKVPDFSSPQWLDDLWDRCSGEFCLDPHDIVHGFAHWFKVDVNAIEIASRVPGCDLDVVRAFAPLHDCMREDDDEDPRHGARAAGFARELHASGQLPLTKDQIKKLAFACTHHSAGRTSTDPTIGACWDADRLDLVRVGTLPSRRYFSSQAAFDLLFQV